MFATAVLFRQQQSHFTAFPALRWGFPQLTLRLCVLDRDGQPAVLCRRLLVPFWAILPSLLTRQPCEAARLHYPRGDEAGPWEWEVVRSSRLCCRAEESAPLAPQTPRLGNWNDTVDYFRMRQRVYYAHGGDLRRLVIERMASGVVPVKAELSETRLLERSYGLTPWPELHSAFLCSDIPMEFLVEPATATALPRQAPVPG